MLVVTDAIPGFWRAFRCKAWDLGPLDWAKKARGRAGFMGVTVACSRPGSGGASWASSPGTRHVVRVRAADAVSWARKTEDLTTDKTDDKDAVIIARLTAQLRCYLPEPIDETWGRLYHLGARRGAPGPPHRMRAADPRPARVRMARGPRRGQVALRSRTGPQR
jgi:hypothetical protein